MCDEGRGNVPSLHGERWPGLAGLLCLEPRAFWGPSRVTMMILTCLGSVIHTMMILTCLGCVIHECWVDGMKLNM